MSYFDIMLESEPTHRWEEDGADGQITIDSFKEGFFSPTGYWTEDQYRSDWRRNVRNFVDGSDKAVLTTSMRDLANTNFLFGWTLYRDEDSATTVYIHNQMIFPDRFPTMRDPERLAEVVLERETTSEDGEPISEWTTTMHALEEFLRRQDDQ